MPRNSLYFGLRYLPLVCVVIIFFCKCMNLWKALDAVITTSIIFTFFSSWATTNCRGNELWKAKIKGVSSFLQESIGSGRLLRCLNLISSPVYSLSLNFPLENVWLLGVWCVNKHFLCSYSFSAGVAKRRLASELSPEKERDSLPSDLSKWRDFHGVQYKFMAYC